MMDEYAIAVDCPHCGATKGTDPIYDGEILRATTCTGCGEWFTIYEE